jgi:hypothetical protein
MPARPALLFGLLLLGLALFVAACSSESSRQSDAALAPTFTKEGTLTFLRPDGTALRTIDVEFAETEAERTRGLMRRRSMGYDKGMLFLFDDASTAGMWMKNTPLPLDVIFVAPDSTVINVVKRTKPFSLDPIQPTAPKKYVVEVRAGFADRFGITPDTRIRWTRTE